MLPTKEQIKKLVKFDHWCQDNDSDLDEKLSAIYAHANSNKEYGWESIANEDYNSFWSAYSLIK